MRRFVQGVGLVLLATFVPVGGIAQEAPARLDASAISSVVQSVSRALRDNYVFPEIAERYATGLLASASEYPAEMTTSELAARVTADLRSIHQDLHLQLIATPSARPGAVQRVVVQGGAATSPGGRAQRSVTAGQAEGGAGQTRVVVRSGDGPAGAPVAPDPDQLYGPLQVAEIPEGARGMFADEAERNHYFRAVEILPGNVGYIDYDQFGMPNFSTAAADAAFSFLSGTRAIILDLRGNRGGIEGMNQYLASHFFGEEPVHLYSRFYGSSRTTVEYPTYPDRVKHRFPDLPVFVLVDGGTGSAAENLSFSLQGLGRATVVGERTAGGAHSSRGLPIEPGFMLQLPIARAFNPRTNQDWEGRGVIPDLEVPSAGALQAAHAAAIDVLLETTTEDGRLALEDAKLMMAAGAAGGSDGVDPAEFVGQYGNRLVFAEEGRLRMRRTDAQGAAPVDLVLLAPDYFTLEQAAVARIRFERDDAGRVVRVNVRLPNGTWETSERR